MALPAHHLAHPPEDSALPAHHQARVAMVLLPAAGFGAPQGGFQPPPGYGSPAPGVPPVGGPGQGQTDTMAIVSLILGILSIPGHFCCYLGWPLGIVSIILGIISYSKINKDPHRWSGKGLALGGIICSAVGFLIIVGLLVVYGAAIFLTAP